MTTARAFDTLKNDLPLERTRTDRAVLVQSGDRLVLYPVRRRDALLARVGSRWLDDRIAGGEPVESRLLLAVRAHQLVRPAHRRRLARAWDEVAARAFEPARLFDVRVPVNRSRLAAAADALHEVGEVLRSDRVVSARGVAVAAEVLTSGRSPLYSRRGSASDLAAAVARALEEF